MQTKFSEQHKKHSSDRFKGVRPEKLHLDNISSTTYKWAECKILGKNILIRSYAGACSRLSELYVYGGLQILKGPLGDFHKINLSDKEPIYKWQQIGVNPHSKTPGPRAKHALVSHSSQIYLIGGISSTVDISNELWVYSAVTQMWELLNPKGDEFPPLESFGCVLVEDKIIVFCGYEGKKCEPVNDVYEYDIKQNSWKRLFQGKKGEEPVGRSGCGCAYDGTKYVYVFGGKAEQRLNDLWRFDLQENKYQKVKDSKDERPNIRNGHSMNYYDGKLYIFGGIHQVTWELDDLHIFDTKNNQWTTLEVDSARKKDNHHHQYAAQNLESVMQPKPAFNSKQSFSARLKKDKTHGHNGIVLYPPRKGSANYDILPEQNNSTEKSSSPNKVRDEQRKKEFLLRKAQLLKTFEVPEKQKNKFITIELTSQAMKNSLDMIGNPNPKVKHQHGKLTDFGRSTYSKFMMPLQNNANIVAGKRPCARDGHNAVQIGNELIFFGGDRHQMSFNDLYRLNMLVVKKQFDHHH